MKGTLLKSRNKLRGSQATMKLRDHGTKQRWGEATAKLDNDPSKQQPTRVMIREYNPEGK
jgi:hypothetical protein